MHEPSPSARRRGGSGPDFVVLDAGAGSAPYRDLFSHVTYEAADVAATPGKDYSHIDYRCDVVDVPVADGRFDLIWCSQVLEHVREPERALREFHRILKRGGEVWLTAPFYYEEHEMPWDFFRYTRSAWEHFAELIGFEVVEIERMEGAFGTVAYSLQAAARAMPPSTGATAGNSNGSRPRWWNSNWRSVVRISASRRTTRWSTAAPDEASRASVRP